MDLGIVTKVMDMVKDIKDAKADGKITKDEAIEIAKDVANIIGELVGLLPLLLK